jgi:hypothetical protein
MPTGFIRLTDPRNGDVWFCSWSTVSDCCGPAITRDELQEVLEYDAGIPHILGTARPGKDYWQDLNAEVELDVEFRRAQVQRRIARLTGRGATFLHILHSGEEWAKYNRMGPRGGCASLEKVIDYAVAQRNIRRFGAR